MHNACTEIDGFNQNSAPQCKSDAARRNEFTQNRLEVIFADRIGGNIVSKQKDCIFMSSSINLLIIK